MSLEHGILHRLSLTSRVPLLRFLEELRMYCVACSRLVAWRLVHAALHSCHIDEFTAAVVVVLFLRREVAPDVMRFDWFTYTRQYTIVALK
jgi:hypothetical protein